jgi:RNA polymerase sigma-70 factor, ECF subfamily
MRQPRFYPIRRPARNPQEVSSCVSRIASRAGASNAKVNPTPIRDVSSPNAKPLPSTVVRDDEGSLVAAAKAGDLNAFQELVSRYEAKIYRLSWNITRNKEDAEDSMQDAFLKAFQHLDGFEGGSRFYTWLVRIAVNEALMKLRKRRPNQVSLDEPVVTDGDELMPRDLQDWGPSPEQRYARSELNQILTDAIEDLDAPYRMAFVLRDVSELSTEETAEALGISVPAVKSRLLRARLKLRQKLDPFFRSKPS